MSSTEKPASQLFREFLGHLAPRRRKQLGLLMILMLAGSLAEIVTIGAVVPFISLMARPEMASEFPMLQGLFAALGWRDPESLLLPMAFAFIGIVGVATGIRLLLIWASNKLVFAIGHDLGVELYRVTLHQSYTFHITQNTSDVIGNVNKVQLLLDAFLRPVMEGIVAAFLSIAILAALMMVDVIIALTAGVLFSTLYFGIMRLFGRRLKENSRAIAETQSTRIRSVQEGLGGIRDVILDGTQPYYSSEFARHDGKFRRAQAANAFFGQAPRFVIEAIGIGLIVCLAYTLSLQTGGLVSALPTLSALALGAARLLPLVQRIYLTWAQYAGISNVLDGVLSSLNLSPPAAVCKNQEKMVFEKQIELKNIDFKYSIGSQKVISDIGCIIPKGSRVGIIGKTGSGKSTLMDVLMGLLEPTGGQILIDGVLVDEGNRRAWQTHISHVPQHIYLSDASIAENIALGVAAECIDDNLVHRAAQQAQISHFIETHRQGYETRVGERGVQLSGGQRQRIGIARALYKDADVLVFDEASSALDQHTEAAVMDAVNELGGNLTIFIIAHRVQTLRECDVLLRLEGGRLISSGTFQEVVGES